MANIHILRTHELGREVARNEVEQIAHDLQKRLDVVWHWDGDTLRFERQGASGTIVVGEHDVVVDVDLGAGLSLFRGMVEREINDYLDRRLG